MSRHRVHSPEVQAEVERLSDGGRVSAAEIADIMGLQPQTVGGILGGITRKRQAEQEDGSPLIRFQKPQPTVVKQTRKCLSHGGMFASEGPHNRICPKCMEAQRHMVRGLDQFSVASGR